MATVIKYRPDIDGLRALAVIAVVLFHAHLPGLNGGYVGVDVFFVISGYLITSIIRPEAAEGRFSIVRFYERRARRLLPALTVVLLLSALLAWFGLLTIGMRDFAKSVGATSLFVSNILFYRESGYFAGPASSKPLLHTWSLAVEEQFYLLYPLILVAAHRFLARYVRYVIAGLALVSFVACVVVTQSKQSEAFYLLPFRAWELGIGALLALGVVPAPRGPGLASAVGVLGIALVVASVVGYSPRTAFPGYAALLPTLGAACLIWSGAEPNSLARRALALGPVVFIGKISYSLYLWHWPALVFAQVYSPDGQRSGALSALVILGATFGAVLSWRFVETPFRRGWPSRPKLFGAAAAVTAVGVVFAVAGRNSDGFPGRIPPEAQPFEAASRDLERTGKICRHLQNDPRFCTIGAPGRARYLLWGDSHAQVLSFALDASARRHGATLLYSGAGGCPPLLGVSREESVSDALADHACAERNRAVMKMVEDHPEIGTVVLVARWSYYMTGHGIGVDEHKTVDMYRTDSGEGRGLDGNAAVVSEALLRTQGELSRLGRKVFVLEQFPEFPDYWSDGLARAFTRQPQTALERTERVTRVPRAAVERRQRDFSRVAERFPTGVVVLRTHDRFCDADDCRLMLGSTPRYWDNNHLTHTTVMSVTDIFDPVFEAPLPAIGAPGDRYGAAQP